METDCQYIRSVPPFQARPLTCLSSSIQTQHQNTHFLGSENLPHDLRDLTTHFARRFSATPERVANDRVFGRSEIGGIDSRSSDGAEKEGFMQLMTRGIELRSSIAKLQEFWPGSEALDETQGQVISRCRSA